MKSIISYKSRDINRVIKVHDAIGLILESANKNQLRLEELSGFTAKYPFDRSLEEIKTDIARKLAILMSAEQAEKEKIGWHAHGDSYEGMKRSESRWKCELEHGFVLSPYKYHLPGDKVHAKQSIVKFMWWIYEQYLLATIHKGTAEIFEFCGLKVTEEQLEAIHRWHGAVAVANGLPGQDKKGTRIRARKNWTLEARKRHSKLMTKKNRERSVGKS